MRKPREVIRPRWVVYALRKRVMREIELPKRSRFRISVRREA